MSTLTNQPSGDTAIGPLAITVVITTTTDEGGTVLVGSSVKRGHMSEEAVQAHLEAINRPDDESGSAIDVTIEHHWLFADVSTRVSTVTWALPDHCDEWLLVDVNGEAR